MNNSLAFVIKSYTDLDIFQTHSLKWLARISEVLDLWVNAALASYDNPPLIGTSDIRQGESASKEVSSSCVKFYLSLYEPDH